MWFSEPRVYPGGCGHYVILPEGGSAPGWCLFCSPAVISALTGSVSCPIFTTAEKFTVKQLNWQEEMAIIGDRQFL